MKLPKFNQINLFLCIRKTYLNYKYENLSSKFINGVVLILMPLWAYLFEGTAEKPEQSNSFYSFNFGVILVLCNGGVKKENKLMLILQFLLR